MKREIRLDGVVTVPAAWQGRVDDQKRWRDQMNEGIESFAHVPISVTVDNFCRISDLGKTTVYGMIASGKLQSIKIGKRRLILMASYRQILIDQLDDTERLKAKAHHILREAVKDGAVTRAPCEICGAVKADGHHEDYNKPLEVRWLCRKHHKRRHDEVHSPLTAEDRPIKTGTGMGSRS
jgi:hypothetical protein